MPKITANDLRAEFITVICPRCGGDIDVATKDLQAGKPLLCTNCGEELETLEDTIKKKDQ
jgi:predicted RNA-binding Zn-ribbon protein involved in translation (DUF1610 family)